MSAESRWPADPGEVRQWTFIVAGGFVHENVNCDGVWNDGDGPEVTVLVDAVARRGHDLVLDEVRVFYDAGLCPSCYASRLSPAVVL